MGRLLEIAVVVSENLLSLSFSSSPRTMSQGSHWKRDLSAFLEFCSWRQGPELCLWLSNTHYQVGDKPKFKQIMGGSPGRLVGRDVKMISRWMLFPFSVSYFCPFYPMGVFFFSPSPLILAISYVAIGDGGHVQPEKKTDQNVIADP